MTAPFIIDAERLNVNGDGNGGGADRLTVTSNAEIRASDCIDRVP